MSIPKDKKYTADEFFELIPESNSELYELHNGEIVVLASPNQFHQEITGEIYFQIKSYIKSNNGKCKPMISPFDVKLDMFNVVIPDISVICDTSKLDGKRCNGAPDWVIEIVSSNRSDDFVKKLNLYYEKGVREYWIVDPKDEKTLVYFFDENNYPNIYTFDTPIPVNIFKNNDVQLEINISNIL